MNFFGRPRNQPARQQQSTPDVAQSILKLRTTVDTLDKREVHIQKKIDAQIQEARQNMKKGDKRSALYCMKRKKMFEGEVDKIRGARMTLEQQALALESSATTMETFKAMREGNQTMRALRANVDADTVGETMDDIRDEIEEANDISAAIGEPLNDGLEDEEALLAELNEMEQLELEQTLLGTPAVPAAAPALGELPAVPTGAISMPAAGVEEDEDLAALRELEADMAAA
eukprot:CAMPEP_0118973260 /NCGR_PEP_ID=MMETSP1173-20130426/9665_1 /TAXON_ID=1034831 /ORGANISM="Rhizochromulina marina cf, Strain CCMP1243" /LENGTH=229 /DNA_ID=CAMNT_0006922881 /DNA_START=68 /DNA_END=757 /DNA_ORIENTATION=-